MRSSPASRPPSWPEPLFDALDTLTEALDRADGARPSTVQPAVRLLDELQLMLRRRPLPPEIHASVRQRIDGVLIRLADLLKDLERERDDVGRALSRLRREKNAPSGARFIDARS